MIKKILSDKFDKRIYSRYIKDLSFTPSIDTLYSNVLSCLNNHETEKAISYMIMILDNDIKFEPIQHLARLLLFSLSEEFIKKKGHAIKSKHPDIFKYLAALENKCLNIERDIIILQNNILKTEEKLKESFINSFLKKREFNSQITNMREEIFRNNDELAKTKKEIVVVNELCKIEEYTKLIAVLLDVVTNPHRFYAKGYHLT